VGIAAGPDSPNYGDALDKFRRAQDNVTQSLERLSKGLGVGVYSDVIKILDPTSPTGYSDNKTYADVSPTVSNYLTARAAKIAVEKAQNSLEQAKSSVQINIDKAKLSVDNAKDDLKNYRKTLAEYEADVKKSEVIAPFDGFITKVNVAGGDAVQRGTIPVQLADPNKFQADIMVSEMDILQVKMGGAAQVQVAAISGLTLSANVTAISPTATIQSGVVNYKVTVEVASMESIMQQWEAARQQAAERAQQSDNTTATRNRPTTGQGGSGQTRQGGQSTTVPAAAPSNFQLKDGLTVTVSILLEQRNNVLQVPNTAITRQGGKSYVKVSNAGGTIEEREIKTGISNWQYTEVTEGLKEGEKVVVPQGTTSSSTQQRQQGPMGGIPGMRIIR
jgi:biotin carboxyl carrier protein